MTDDKYLLKRKVQHQQQHGNHITLLTATPLSSLPSWSTYHLHYVYQHKSMLCAAHSEKRSDAATFNETAAKGKDALIRLADLNAAFIGGSALSRPSRLFKYRLSSLHASHHAYYAYTI